VEINCAAIPPNLLESELFGHEKGAFTDAHRGRVGLFEEANSGTLFLDEIGHLPLDLQGKLLRALEQKQIRRVGSTENRDIDVRIIAATHVDLRDAIHSGEFREDLFYRLNVISLHLPPLRDRGGDIELLARRFVSGLADRYGLPIPDISTELVTKLGRHSWPGNVRELRHALERAILLSPAGTIDENELALETNVGSKSNECEIPFPATLREIDCAAGAATVRACDDNKSAAARRLGISRARLQRLLDGYDDEAQNA
jgi:two-component system response regulator HydG